MTLNQAATELGVHYMTAYRYVRTGRLAAVKVGAEWRVDPADVAAMKNGTAGTVPVGGAPSAGPGHGRRRRHDYHLRLERRLLAGDETGSWAIVESAITAGIEPDEVYLEVLAPAMARIGEEWAAGRVSVADEHRASVVMYRIIGRLGPHFTRRGRKRGTVVVGAAPGDHHGVPVALAADLLRGHGFTVVDLGADTPSQSFVDAALGAERLIGVGISATSVDHDDVIAATIARLHEEVGCPVVVGGLAVASGDAASALGADEVTRSAPELLEAFDRFASRSPRAR